MKTSDISVDLIGYYGDDNSVANAARVSFHKEASHYTNEQNNKLIAYLAKHKHLSPFNHCFLSFRVKAPIFVGRQLVKHKFLPWNEVSRRYVDEEPEFYVPAPRCRAENVKQGSSDDRVELNFDYFTSSAQVALSAYENLLSNGVAPEVARTVLPQNMFTEWVWSGTLGAFAAMLVLRLDSHTQEETRQVAQLIYKEIYPLFPVSIEALLEAG